MSTDTYTTFLREPEPKDREQSIEAYVKARLQSLDRAVAGYTSVSLQGLTGDVDLTPTQAKHRVIQLTGAPSGAVTVRIPHATGANADPIFVNASTATVTVKSMGANAGNSSGVSLAAGASRHVRHDGESAYPAAPAQTAAGTSYAARVYNGADLSIANATATALTFGGERRDDGSLHSLSSNTDRLTAPVAGWYLVWGNVEFASNAVGFRTVSFRVGAAPDIHGAEQAVAVSGDVTIVASTCLVHLAANDYVRFFVYQNSGGALSVRYTQAIAATSKYSPEFGMILLMET